jgi:hypothetical protein
MSCVGNETSDIELLTTVALLRDLPERGVARGQVGTVVETLDARTVLVEFSDDDGRAYAVAPCDLDILLPLKTTAAAA